MQNCISKYYQVYDMNRMIAQYRFALHKIVKICATEIYDLQLVHTTILVHCTLCACILTCTRTCWLNQNVTYPYYLLQFMILLEHIYAIYKLTLCISNRAQTIRLSVVVKNYR